MIPSDDEEEEEWRQARGRWVSSLGRYWKMREPRSAIFPAAGRNDGYRTVDIDYTKVQLHDLIAEAFLPPRPSSKHTVDHINRNSMDNRVVNLRWATKSEQMENRVLPKNTRNSCAIELNFGQGWIRLASQSEAHRRFGIDRKSLRLCARGEITHAGGAKVRMIENTRDDPDECWKWTRCRTMQVSNKGRVHVRRAGVFRTYHPLPRKPHGYCIAKTRRVHILVMEAFGPPKPSDLHTVDHINRCRHDNRIENLRWATPVEQTANRSL